MTSRKIEDVHQILLKKLLSDSGLECIRTAPVSLESSSSSEHEEEQGPVEAEEEAAVEHVPEEEPKPPEEEATPEELSDIFPSPSLRRVLPDRIRRIEDQNRIHVLPEEFNLDIDPLLIPRIATTAPQKYIEILATMVGCSQYESSLPEYWFLDTMANLLRRAQQDQLDRATQAVLIQWFCEWMKEIQNFDAADRKRMLRRFEDSMVAAAQFIATEARLPAPSEAGVYYKQPEEPSPTRSAATARSVSSRARSVVATASKLVTFQGTAFECCLRDLTKIIHYIFDLFITDYQYNLVRSIFTFSPGYTLIDAPYQLQQPKRLYAPLKIKPKKEKAPKKEKPAKGKGKKEVVTEEFLALMELKAKEDRELEELEEQQREEWNRRSHILPLGLAADEEFFNKYWPPPPVELEPEPDPEPAKKGKGKK